MKRNFFALGALVLAIAVSSFSTRFVQYKYFVYKGSGIEKSMSSFNQQTAQPSHVLNSGVQALNWFRVTDIDEDGIISVDEFETSFETYDVVNTSSNLLKDESADVSTELDLRNL